MNTNTKQLKNFIHNTLGISKMEIQSAILEAAKAEGTAHARRMLQANTDLIKTTLVNAVEAEISKAAKESEFNSGSIKSMVKSQIASLIVGKIDIKLK